MDDRSRAIAISAAPSFIRNRGFTDMAAIRYPPSMLDTIHYIPPEGRSRRRELSEEDAMKRHNEALALERARFRAEHDANVEADRIIAERRAEMAEIALGKD